MIKIAFINPIVEGDSAYLAYRYIVLTVIISGNKRAPVGTMTRFLSLNQS